MDANMVKMINSLLTRWELMKEIEPNQQVATKTGLNIMLNGGTTPEHVDNLVLSIQNDLSSRGIYIPDEQVLKGKGVIIILCD